MYAVTAPVAVQPLYAACMALLYALLIAGTRWALLERRYRVGAPLPCCGPTAAMLPACRAPGCRFSAIEQLLALATAPASADRPACCPPAPPGLQGIQRSERQLAGADSHFFPIGGIDLHYKQRLPLKGRPAGAAGGAPLALHCLHGFGASAYSWSFVQQELADALGAVVTAHDMPGERAVQVRLLPHCLPSCPPAALAASQLQG